MVVSKLDQETHKQWEYQISVMSEELPTWTQLAEYPAETIKRVSKLAEKVSAKYRESRRKKLKRTFMQANDAAEQKAKRTFK
ncbi:hypothetical protein K1T71_015019 [Dendrolimus kikuchii]|nr:hypothetical protein K1T71_015019 [Dendrolimus kikuchii]